MGSAIAPHAYPAEDVAEWLRNATCVQGIELAFNTPAGLPKWVTASFCIVRDDERACDVVEVVIQDLTAHKLAEEELKQRIEFENVILTISTNLISVAPEDMDRTASVTRQ